MNDKIFLTDLKARCRVGITEKERRLKQKIILSIEIETDLKAAGLKDDLNLTLDYDRLRSKIKDALLARDYKLLEAVTENVARICLEMFPKGIVTVSAAKTIYSDVRRVGVSMTRGPLSLP